MAFIKIENIKISGISACVPKNIEYNKDFPLFKDDDYAKFLASAGIEQKRVCDENTCASDLCIAAAETLIKELSWNKEDISFLIFVSLSPDYMQPNTSSIIHYKLGLSKECFVMDIALGCSGWVYGISVISSLILNLSSKEKSKALLLVSETASKFSSREDKSTYPLFGDAGTATALEYYENAEPILFSLNTDGKGYNSIIINDGGYRNPVTSSSLEKISYGDGIVLNNLQLKLDGMNVFAFATSTAPRSVNGLIEYYSLNKENIDFFTFHQANFFMNEQIRKKLKLPIEKVPYTIKEFGNTGCASVPLTMVVEMKNELEHKKLQHISCGFGSGLSWGSVYFKTDCIKIPQLVEI